jgi:hypothetical protein
MIMTFESRRKHQPELAERKNPDQGVLSDIDIIVPIDETIMYNRIISEYKQSNGHTCP